MKSKFTIIKCIALIIGVLVIPVLYSYFYLDAFWDPYNSLDKMPVAVVNEDEGAVINGQSRNLGSEMVDRMKSDDQLKWVFTSAEDAKNGVDGKKYYAYFVIPTDFSSDIASASTTTKTEAKIEYSTNEKRNYLASQILSRAVVELEEETRSNINKELTTTLSDKLRSVPTSLGTLKTGLDQLSTGASSLNSGVQSATSGQQSLNSGILSLSSGLQTLSVGNQSLLSGATSLDGGISQLLTGANTLMLQFKPSTTSKPTLYDGITQLNGGLSRLKAQLVASPGGSQNTAVDQFNTGANTYANNQVALMLGILTTQYKAVYTSAITGGATQAVAQATAAGTIQQISAGLKSTIEDELPTLAANYIQYGSTNPTVQAEQATLVVDVNMYDLYNTFYNAVLLKGTTDQSLATNDFIVALKQNQYSYANSTYATFVAPINAQNAALSVNTFTSQVNTGLFGALYSSVGQLSNGSQSLAAQLTTAASGQDATLYDGVSQIAGGLSQVKDGSFQLVSGAQQAAAGASSAASGAGTLASGSSQLTSGMPELSSGSAQLAEGASSASSGVADSITTANKDAEALNGLDEYAAKPVSINKSYVNPVPNYGTAFAPYFLSLSLWVGALIVMVGIYLDPNEKIKTLSRSSKRRELRTLGFAIIGVGQAVLLAFVIRFGLHLEVKSTAGYVWSCILIAFTFMSIVQCMIINLKDFGKFLAIAFLILQLTSCGGTFPMETVPKIFNVLYPYMPMTYSVGLFKEVVSGINSANAWYNTYVLLAIFVAFTSINVIFAAGRKAKVHVAKRLKAQSETNAD